MFDQLNRGYALGPTAESLAACVSRMLGDPVIPLPDPTRQPLQRYLDIIKKVCLSNICKCKPGQPVDQNHQSTALMGRADDQNIYLSWAQVTVSQHEHK